MSSLILAIKARIYREGLSPVLSGQAGWTLASAVADTAAAMTAVAQCQPDAILLDIDFGGALEVVSQVHQASPSTRVVALGIRPDHSEELLAWAEAGAVGFVTCDNSIDELVTCVHLALQGELACSPRIAATLLRRVTQLSAERAQGAPALPFLTPRQHRVLQLIRSGQSNKQIARELGIELATVKNHVHGLLQRLQVSHRHEAAASLSLPWPSSPVERPPRPESP